MAAASLMGDPCLSPQTSQVTAGWFVRTFQMTNLSQLKVKEKTCLWDKPL